MNLVESLERRSGLTLSNPRDLVLAISRIPYGRTVQNSPEAVIAEYRGTCSTKHLLLQGAMPERWSKHHIKLWHRPYWVTRELAHERWGADIAAVVPNDGLGDVHTFATMELGSRAVRVDVTVPLESWDGVSDTPLWCGEGRDVPAGDDPLGVKRLLVAQHCDPAVREPFIAALSLHLVP